MKAFFRWLGRIVASALTLVLTLALLPYASRLIARIMPDESGATIRASAVISTRLKESSRLETQQVTQVGVMYHQIMAAFIGPVADVNVEYQYDASIGIDLSKVVMQRAGSTLVFYIPDVEVLNDSLTPIESTRNDWWYPFLSDKDYNRMLEEERVLRRDTYLSENRDLLWEASVTAFEKTIGAWLQDVGGQVTFRFLPIGALKP